MVKNVLVCAFVLAGFVGTARPVLADCTNDLLDCYTRAAKIDNFWYRTAAALDCELDFASCVRLLLVGA